MIESAPTVPATQVHPAVQTRARSRRRIQWSAYLYILPAFVIISAFHIIPVFYAIYISLNKGPINKWKFVGLENYIRAFSGAEFWNSLATTFAYSLLTMPFTIALGLFFAYLLVSRRARARRVSRHLFPALRGLYGRLCDCVGVGI